MPVTPAHPGPSATGEAAPGLELLSGVTRGHQCHVLPVPTTMGGGNGAEVCSQTLSVQQFLKKFFIFREGKGLWDQFELGQVYQLLASSFMGPPSIILHPWECCWILQGGDEDPVALSYLRSIPSSWKWKGGMEVRKETPVPVFQGVGTSW